MQGTLKKEVVLLTPLASSYILQTHGPALRLGALPDEASPLAATLWRMLQLPKYHVKVGHRADRALPLTSQTTLVAESYHRTRRYNLLNYFELLYLSQYAEQLAITELYREIHARQNIRQTVIHYAERLGVAEDDWDLDTVIRTYNNHKRTNHPLYELAKTK